MTATPTFATGVTTLTFTGDPVVNATGFDTAAFVERVDVVPQVSLVDSGDSDLFEDITFVQSITDTLVVTAKILTAAGTVEVDTAFKKFGTASALSTNVGTDFISTPDSSDFDFGGGDFTIEAFVRLTNSATNGTIYNQWGAAGTRALFLQINHANGEFDFSYTTDGTTVISAVAAFTDTPILATNVFIHLAVVRSGADLKMFVDGVQFGTTFNIGSDVIFNSTSLVRIGGITGILADIEGNKDEFRVSDSARFTATFTPTTSAYTPDENTKLLIHFDGTDGSTTFTDDSPTIKEVEDEYSFEQTTAEEDFKVKLTLSREDTSLTIKAKRLGVGLYI